MHGFGAQAGHKVDTPAPSFSGVSGPSVTFYREVTVNYRLPTIANANAAHDVSYAVTPALPAGYSLNSSTAAITGSRSRSTDAVARSNYTLRATDGFSRTADLTFSLEVKTDGGIESITITSNPGTDKTYGKTSDFGPNDTISVRVDFTHRFGTVLNFDDRLCLSIRIGANTRRQCNPATDLNTAGLWDKLDFSYAVQESDWDGDGISFPGNPLSVTGSNSLRFDSTAISNTAVNVNFGAIPDDPNHKVRGRQTTPTFGTTASPAYVWITDDAVSQELPAATDGDGGVTYGIKERLPSGLSFTAATRTLAGAPGAAQAVTTYTLVATDADSDKAELAFSIRIDDITVSISSPSVSEGAAPATLTFAVTLNQAAGRTVTVAYGVDGTDPGTATAGTDYTTVAGGTLTFGAADTSRTFDVAVTDDRIDEPDETVRITLRNPSGAGLGTATGTGTITDDDTTPTVTLALTDASIAENGGATTVTATLSGRSSAATTITVEPLAGFYAIGTRAQTIQGIPVSGPDPRIVIAAGQTANAADTALVAAVDNTVDAPDRTATVTASAANSHAIGAVTGAGLTITDDDPTPTATLMVTPAAIAENGGTATVTAGLSHPSSEATTLTVSAVPGTGASSADFALTGSTLTIAAGAAVDNVVHAADKSVTVRATAAGGRGVAAPADVTLTLTEDETAPRATLALTPASIAESGTRTAATVTASLNRASDAPTTVTVTATAVPPATAADFVRSANMRLEIAPGTTASTGRVLVTAVNDTAYTGDKSVTVAATAHNRHGVTAPGNVTLTITDDEMAAPGTPGNVGVTPGVGSLAVSWTAVPDADGYKVQWKTGAEAWDTGRQIAVTGTTITGLTAGTAYTMRVIATRAHADDGPASSAVGDQRPTPAPPGRVPTVTVTREVGQLAVSWTAVPDADGYKVHWKEAGGAYDAATRQHTPTDTSYTIPNLAPGTTYTVRVIATRMSATDSPPSAERTGTPRAAAPGKPAGVTLTSGVRRIAVAWTAVADADRYTVQWKVDGGTYAAANEETVTGTSYTVTGLTAGTAYTVRVTAERDHAADGPASDEAAATAWDVTLSATALTLDEDPGNTNADRDTYTLRLSHAPTGSVTVTAASSDPAVTLAPTSLTFTTTTWNTAQAVTATAADDDDTNGETVTLSHAAPGFGTVAGTVTDDDMAGLTVSDVTGDAMEVQGDAATVAVFDVRLATEPTAPVTVAVTSQKETEGVAAPANLTFTTMTWNTAQTVTVTGVDDDFDDGNVAYAIHLDPAGEAADAYAALATHTSTSVTTVDADMGGVTFAPTELTVTEGGVGKTITMVLTASPPSGVTVWVGLIPHCKITVGGRGCGPNNLNLGFTAADWNTAQTVVVKGVHDNDGEDETVPLQYALSGFGAPVDIPDETPQTAVTVEDDNVPALVVNPTALTVAEGESATYTVRLRVAPDAAVTVAVEKAAGGSTDVSFAPTADLVFATGAWNTAQTVTATAANDDDATSETAVTLSHRVSGTGDTTAYPTTLAAVTVTVGVTDDDTVGVSVDTDPSTAATVDSTALTVSDDGSTTTDTYTVVLHTQPSGAVTITPAVPATPDVVDVAPAGLTFDTTSWNTAQTVTVSGKTDTDAADTNVSLTHTLTTVQNGDYAGVGVAAVAVTVTDADTVGVTVDTDPATDGAQTTALAVTEGATGVYTLALATQPSDPVTLAVTATPAEVGLAPETLTFAAAAWNTAQTVTVSGTPDDDPDDETVTLAHTLTTAGTGDYAAVTVADVTVQVTDDEVVVGFESATQSAAEDAGQVSVCVAVTNPQTGEPLSQDFTLWLRTVDGVATDGSAAVAGTDYMAIVDQDAGPFTATTRRQCTALEVLDNAVDAADKTLTLELDYRPDTTTPDPNDKEGTEDYVILSPGTLTFTITDDDVRGVTVDTDLTTTGVQATTLSVSEDGTTTAAYAVVLGHAADRAGDDRRGGRAGPRGPDPGRAAGVHGHDVGHGADGDRDGYAGRPGRDHRDGDADAHADDRRHRGLRRGE